MMLFNPPSMPCEMVGARTVMPRTTPLYSRTLRPCTSNVVETIMDGEMAMRSSPPTPGSMRSQRLGKIAPSACPPSAGTGMIPRLMTTLSAGTVPPGLTRSLVGKKVVMAVTGVILFGFVVAHLLGNLKVFQGPEHFNAYAEGLRTVGAPFFGRGWVLWIVRSVLLVSVFAHIWAAVEVTPASWGARPVAYHRLDRVETTYAARTMRWGGVIIVVYVVYHLLDLTFGRLNPSFGPGVGYHNLVASFQRWPVSLAYIVAVSVGGLAAYNGPWGAPQTRGLNRPPTFSWRRRVAGGIPAAH